MQVGTSAYYAWNKRPIDLIHVGPKYATEPKLQF